MSTFTEYKESLQAREEVAAAVLRHTEELCKVLEDNFKSRNHGKVGRHDAPVYKFVIETGRKYHKIVMEMPNLNRDPSRSVHAFVDKKTGSVDKPASFKAPAKHERFNLCLIKDREWLLENADWSGQYLYAR